MKEVSNFTSTNPKSTEDLFAISKSKETGTGHQRSTLGQSIMTQKKGTKGKSTIKIGIHGPINIQCPQSSATLKSRRGQTGIMANNIYVRSQESPMFTAGTIILTAIEHPLMMISSSTNTAIVQRLTSIRSYTRFPLIESHQLMIDITSKTMTSVMLLNIGRPSEVTPRAYAPSTTIMKAESCTNRMASFTQERSAVFMV